MSGRKDRAESETGQEMRRDGKWDGIGDGMEWRDGQGVVMESG